MHVHLLHTPAPEHLALLRDLLDASVTLTTSADVPQSTQIIVSGSPSAQQVDIPPSTQVLIGGRPSAAQLDSAPDLHTLVIPFAGLPATTRTLMADYPHIAIHNLHHNAPMTAEMALALLLSAAKLLVPVDKIFRTHDWTPRYQPVESRILDGKTALILGYGAVGQRVGLMCQAMGMEILAIRRTVRADDDPDVIFPAERLHELLPRTHALIVCLPGTPETEGMIDADALKLMPPGGVLVNIGRAAVVDAQALYDALKNGHLHAAGLDVWYTYPPDTGSRTHTPPADVPFHELDNVVMSPHRAGGGGADEVEQRRMHALASSINAAAQGNPMPHHVDLSAGY